MVHNIYFAPGKGANYCSEYVCLCAHITEKTVQLNFTVNMLPVAMAWFCSDGTVMRYLLLVLWMT